MEANYDLLPKRNSGNTDGSSKKWYGTKFFTNYYEIQIDKRKNKIYQYSFQLNEQVPDDSPLYYKSVRNIKKKLIEKIGLISFKGKMLWGTIPCQVPFQCPIKFDFEEKEYVYEGFVKMTKELNIRDLMESEESKAMILQVLNVDMKNQLRRANMHELGKASQYYTIGQHDRVELKPALQKGLSVLRGFKFTIAPLNQGIYLQIDVCSRVLQKKNLLQIFNGHPRDENRAEFQGSTIITKYGTYRTYRIEEIDYNLNPMSKFTKGTQSITYMDYFKQAYQQVITNNRQPLLKVVGRMRREIKNGKLVETPEYIYLIPELVSPTGMRDQQRANFETMKAIAPFTKLSPQQRIKDCQDMVNKFNNSDEGLIKIGSAKRMGGYILDRPDLIFGGNKVKPDEKGSVKVRSKLKNPPKIKDWVFVYSVGKNSKYDDEDADKAVNLLVKAGQTYGIQISDPGFLIVQGRRVEDWKRVIEEDIKKNSKPELICFFVNQHEDKYYGDLKRWVINDLGVPSQFIKRRTLTNPKGAMSAASKIDIQMSTKIGGTPWEVAKNHNYFAKKSTMYGALSLSKGKKGFTLAFVGTSSNDSTKVYSQCKVGIKRKEEIPPDLLNKIFYNWARTYFKNTKTVPGIIMLYREGLSSAQASVQIKPEIEALHYMINQIGEKTKTKNYKPEIVYMMVNKKISSRFFTAEQDNPQQGNKFLPKVFNPNSGSVIVEEMSKNDSYDFHLAAQLVTQGTCTPTHYTVAYNESKIPQEALISFTYEQCFNYYNWQGAVRVPACLQCADKLAKLVGEHVRQDIVESDNSKRHYFL